MKIKQIQKLRGKYIYKGSRTVQYSRFKYSKTDLKGIFGERK